MARECLCGDMGLSIRAGLMATALAAARRTIWVAPKRVRRLLRAPTKIGRGPWFAIPRTLSKAVSARASDGKDDQHAQGVAIAGHGRGSRIALFGSSAGESRIPGAAPGANVPLSFPPAGVSWSPARLFGPIPDESNAA